MPLNRLHAAARDPANLQLNQLLGALLPEQRERWLPHLESVDLHCGQVLLYAHEDGEVAMCDLCLVTVTAIDECDLEWTWRTLAEARCMQPPSRMHAATSSGRAALAKARANAMFRGVRT